MKSSNIVSDILRRLIFIGFSAQIILGLCWIVKNFLYVQLFGDTYFYVQVSSHLACDEYTEILYPAVLLIIRAIGEITHLRWYSLMYLLQLMLACFSGFYLLKQIGFANRRSWLCFWGGLGLLTFPFALQIHMAILPHSFSVSFLLLETAFYIKMQKSKYLISGKHFAFEIGKVCLFWLLAALTETVNIYVGAIPVVALLCKVTYSHIKKHKKGIFYPIIICAIFLGLIFGVKSLYQTKGLYGRAEMSIQTILFDRMAWKSSLHREGSWPQILTDVVEPETMRLASNYPHDVKKVLEPELEKKLGAKGAQAIYAEIVSKVIKYDKAELLHDVAIDTTGYVCSPIIVWMLLKENTYISDTIRNFDIFKRNSPVLSKYYLDYSLLLFIAAVGISILISVIRLVYNKKNNYKNKRPNKAIAEVVLVICITCLMVVISGVMRGSGVYDYKLSVYPTVMWLVAILMISKLGEG